MRSQRRILEEYYNATTVLAWIIGRMAVEDSKPKRDELAARAIGICAYLEPIEKEDKENGNISKATGRSLSV